MGQYQDMVGPWAAEASGIKSRYGTSPLSADAAGMPSGAGYFGANAHNPVGDMIHMDASAARMYQGQVDASQQLALSGLRTSGTLSRQVRTVSGPGGLGFDTPVRQGALRTYSNAQPLGGLGATTEERCGSFAPGSDVWSDPRNTLGAILAYTLAYGWSDVPASLGPAASVCLTGEINLRLADTGRREIRLNKMSASLEKARIEAGGVPNLGWAALPLEGAARLLEWKPRDVEALVVAAQQVDWTSPDWLNQWADVTGPSAKDLIPGGAPVVSASAGGAKTPWYTNPWILGAGAIVTVGGVWFLTK
jgi:hypothetical protein